MNIYAALALQHQLVKIDPSDGSMEVLADDDGRFSLKLLERGNHVIEAFSGTQRSAPVVFDRDSREVRLELD